MSDDPVVPPALEDAIKDSVASFLTDPQHPTRIAYDRTRADFPDGGEDARAAFHRYLREEKKKRDDELAEVKVRAPKAPQVGHDGVPYCGRTECPKYGRFTGRCEELGVDDAPEICIPAVRDMVLELDARKDAADPAFDEIIKLCGLAKTWEYPGQVVRDVEDALKKRDEMIKSLAGTELPAYVELHAALDAEYEHLGAIKGAEQTIGRLRTDLAAMIQTNTNMQACIVYARDRRSSAFDFDTWIRMVEHALDSKIPPGELENAQAVEHKALQAVTSMRAQRDGADKDRAWLRAAWDTEIKTNEELREKLRVAESVRDDARAHSQRLLDEKRALEENAVRMREYRFAMENIPTDGKGNPLPGDTRLPAWAQPGLPSARVRDLIIAEVGMMAQNRTPQMQAAYDAAVAREQAEEGDVIPRMGNLRSPEQQAVIDANLADEPPNEELQKIMDIINSGVEITIDDVVRRADELVPGLGKLVRAISVRSGNDNADVPCSCSSTYIELKPGVHSLSCARSGQPLSDGMVRYTCVNCKLTVRHKIDKCLRCGGAMEQA